MGDKLRISTWPDDLAVVAQQVDRATFKDTIFLNIANLLGQLGTCDRKRVGAVITFAGRCVSWGFNGAPPGLPHCEENQHGWLSMYQALPEFRGKERLHAERAVQISGCRNATHAEANALAFAARQGISTVGGTLYVTVSPCKTCARLLIAAGITRVVYAEEYRDPAGVELLVEGGVQVG